jgi:uracil-DNA glycosylase family 4
MGEGSALARGLGVVQGAGVDASAAIEILLSELRRLRSEGVDSVSMGAEAEQRLRELLARSPGVAAGVPAPAAATRLGATRAPDVAPVKTPAAEAPPAGPPKPRAAATEAEAMPAPPVLDLPAAGSREERWAALCARLGQCEEARRRRPAGVSPFVGHGSTQPDLVFVTEHPEEGEEVSGDPFAGPSGELLGKAIRAMGLGVDRVHVAPVLRWRPVLPSRVGSRPPTSGEIAYCLPFLRAQVEILAPKVVVALGNVPLNALAGAGGPLRITQERGAWREAMGIPLLPTYLPSYLLRNPSPKVKREFWEDLLAVMERLGLPISERQRGFYR